ncbi:MAG: cellulose binding domain-containing protein [Clostridia bacterium]|nr:cellulose binding domain-containing protein [Clostridia bacterium]MDD4387224.1 cellulose binding domain-containing protein [Clostridia bacterium]
MRRLKSIMKNNILKIILGVFVFSIIFIGIGYSLLVTNLNITGKVNLIASEPPYKLSYIIDSWFSKGKYYYNVNITITNNSNSILENWFIKMDFPINTSIANAWNTTYQIANNTITFSNMSYNGNIGIGESTDFGFQINDLTGDFYCKNVSINGIQLPDSQPPEPIPQGNVVITFFKSSQWQSDDLYYYNYNVTVNNMTNKKIKSWAFDMIFDSTTNVSEIWDAKYITAAGKIVVSNMTYNGGIVAGGNVTFRMIIKTKNSNYIPQATNIVYK